MDALDEKTIEQLPTKILPYIIKKCDVNMITIGF